MPKRKKGYDALVDREKQVSVNEQLRILRRDGLRTQSVFVTTNLGLVRTNTTNRGYACVDSGTEVAANRSRFEYKLVRDLSTDSWDIDRGFKSCFWLVERLSSFRAQYSQLKFDQCLCN